MYARLRRTAERFLAGERVDHTLQPTALVHEAWLRLAAWHSGREEGREPGRESGRESGRDGRRDRELADGELQLLAGHVMRRVLTDHARRRSAAKRDAARRSSDVDVAGLAAPGGEGPDVVLEVDRALTELAALDPELAQVVELRFFGGHAMPDVAALLGVSLRTANRRWSLARAWLVDALGGASGTGGAS